MFRSDRLDATGERIDVSMVEIKDVAENNYFINAGRRKIAYGGHVIDVFGSTSGYYYVGSKEIKTPGLRMHLNISSVTEEGLRYDGIIGWATIHPEYVEAGIVLDKDYIRDVLYELRRDRRRELRVAGHSVNKSRFAIDMFMMSATESPADRQ